MSKEEKIVLTGKVGTLIDGSFHPNVFNKSTTDGTYRKLTIQLSGFKQPNDHRIIDPTGDEMDLEIFISSLKVINQTGDSLIGINGERVYKIGDEVWFRMAPPTSGEYKYSVHDDECIYLELDLCTPCKGSKATVDGYTGVEVLMVSNETFSVSYTKYDKPKTKKYAKKRMEKPPLFEAYPVSWLHDSNPPVKTHGDAVEALMTAVMALHRITYVFDKDGKSKQLDKFFEFVNEEDFDTLKMYLTECYYDLYQDLNKDEND